MILTGARSGARFFQDAPHGSAIFSKFSRCSARERDFQRRSRETCTEAIPKYSAQDRPLNEENHLERSTPVLVQYSSSIDLIDFLDITFINDQNFQNAPHGSVIFIEFDEDAQHGSAILKIQRR